MNDSIISQYGNVVGHINKVSLCPTWLVLRCVIVYDWPPQYVTKPTRPTQPPILIGMEDKYMCTSESKMMLCSQEVKAGNNNNNNCDNVYGAIIMT